MPSAETPRALHVLVAATIPSPAVADSIAHLSSQDCIALRAIVDLKTWETSADATLLPNVSTDRSQPPRPFKSHDHAQHEAAALCAWADVLILAPMDANTLAHMLHGVTNSLVLEILRSWDVSKRILLVPGMSTLMWENPMTKKQLSKIRRKWNWVRVLSPLLWTFEAKKQRFLAWDGGQELLGAVQNQVDLATLGHDVELALGHVPRSSFSKSPRKTTRTLPPELWSIILDFTGDWELAKRLNVYTTLPVPNDWQRAASAHGPQTLTEKLDWAILTGTLDDVKTLLRDNPIPQWLSRTSIRIIMRFAMVPLLTYLETSHKDLFWATFGSAFLPDKASALFGRVEILEYWRTSPTFLNKEYTVEAIDGASRAGYVHVLEWWHQSGLPLKYTEAALEQASSKGQIEVLDWWKAASTRADGVVGTTADDAETAPERSPGPLRLKPGKSISFAVQQGSLATLRWWVTSSIPFTHEDTVAKLASTHGHVDILAFWHSLHGEKMIYDNQVLVGATKMGHGDVLEWWKRSGLRVEYKICDIEEALEDGVEGAAGTEVRRWWARNGLNLGVATSEWMRTMVLK